MTEKPILQKIVHLNRKNALFLRAFCYVILILTKRAQASVPGWAPFIQRRGFMADSRKRGRSMEGYMGIDIGGTKCAVVRGDEKGKMVI